MRIPSYRAALGRFAESRALGTDLSRASRATIAFIVPLVLLPHFHLPISPVFVALGAQNLAVIDARGAYSLRVALLASISLVLAAYGGIGAFFAGQVLWAAGLTALLTVATGFWRHLSTDYGASISISSLLMLFLGLAGTPGLAAAQTTALSILCGGAFALLLQTSAWPFRPQYPLRVAVAESWVAAADLFSALAPVPSIERGARHDRITQAETLFHAAIDKTALFLIQAANKKASVLLDELESLNLCAARLALTVENLNAVLEGCMSEEDWLQLAPAIDAACTTLTNLSRSTALTVVSRSPAQLATARIRLRRAEGLLGVLKSRIPSETDLISCRAQLERIIEQILDQLPKIIATLERTVERANERFSFAAELLDLNSWMLRPLAATMNLGQRPDAALVRYVFRLAVLTTCGVAAFQYFHLPHGYWLPFTSVVVLQPDFGATRQRAAQRVGGTLAGSVVATAILWLHPSPTAVLFGIAACVFGYAYILRRNYGLAIFFVTIFVVLLLETGSAGIAQVAYERVLATCAGGALSFGAAWLFWPTWERDRFPAILGRALRANAEYLKFLLRDGPEPSAEFSAALHRAKREVEKANSAVFASLRRMLGDPRNRREGVERYAALGNGNQRLTRILNVVFSQPRIEPRSSTVEPFRETAASFLTHLADAIEQGNIQTPPLAQLAKTLESSVPRPAPGESAKAESHWLNFQCGRIATELGAMAAVAQGDLNMSLRSEQTRSESLPSPALPAK